MKEVYFCPNCMKDMGSTGTCCPHCGKETDVHNEGYQLPVGCILNGRYLIGRVIGAGGFGITYMGYDLKLNARVAIKEFFMSGAVNRTRSMTVIPSDERSQSAFSKGAERFLEEAKVLAQFIDEPGIVSVRDFFQENATAYIVMEYLEGQDLRHYVKQKGPISFDEALELLEPAILALDKIHTKGLIHRDISPANLMLLGDGSLKVLDFGTAREQSISGERSLSVMLKPGFAPEEQYRSHGQQGPWTDVYAMCATIYRLITGKNPPAATDRAFEDKMYPPSALGAKITPAQEAVLLRGMAVKSENRIRSMGELLQCLKGEKKLKPVIPWKKIGTAAAALVLLLGAGFAASLYMRAGTEPSETAPAATVAAAKPEGEWVKEVQSLVASRMEYDRDGNLYTSYVYEYDEYGDSVRSESTYHFGGDYSYYYTYEYDYETFDSIRLCTEEISTDYTFFVSQEIKQETDRTYKKYKYEFTPGSRDRVQYAYNESDELISYTEYYFYENGNERYYYAPDGSLKNYEVGERINNEDGSYIWQTTRYNPDGSIKYVYESKYDTNGENVGFLNYDENMVVEYETFSEYTYDAEGNVIREIETRRSYSGGQVSSEDVYTIENEYIEMEVFVWKEK